MAPADVGCQQRRKPCRALEGGNAAGDFVVVACGEIEGCEDCAERLVADFVPIPVKRRASLKARPLDCANSRSFSVTGQPQARRWCCVLAQRDGEAPFRARVGEQRLAGNFRKGDILAAQIATRWTAGRLSRGASGQGAPCWTGLSPRRSGSPGYPARCASLRSASSSRVEGAGLLGRVKIRDRGFEGRGRVRVGDAFPAFRILEGREMLELLTPPGPHELGKLRVCDR